MNVGAPWTSYRDGDTLARTTPDQNAYGVVSYGNWMLSESFPLTVGTAPPANSAPNHVVIGDSAEYISCPDETPDVFAGATRLVIAWRATTDSSTADNSEICRKFASIRCVVDAEATGTRYSINIDSASNFSTTQVRPLPQDSGTTFHSYIMSYDGNRASGDRILHIYDGEVYEDSESNIPTSITQNSSQVLQLGGNRLSNSPAGVLIKDMVIWVPSQAVTETELASIFHGDEPDIESLSVGGVTPSYFLRPSCGDSLTTASGVTNLGSVTSDCSGVNHEAGDLVADGDPVCP